MKKTRLIIFLLSATLSSKAQSLASSVIAASGDQFTSSRGSLDWTLGEIMTETYSQSNRFFTQGFQQPATVRVTGLEEEEVVKVYPNPTKDILHVMTVASGDYVFELFNMQGQRMVEQKAQAINGTQVHKIDLTDFRVALYLLRISNTTTGKNVIHKIEKL
ncbi:MAG: T9SS type A sorting domain-containing protein [Cyclobacteriaceae bacterium]|nr:T9SS type A sorting domain-containing protein [Cyclobacteriaceae bacterium]